jgi:hypothetical protein
MFTPPGRMVSDVNATFPLWPGPVGMIPGTSAAPFRCRPPHLSMQQVQKNITPTILWTPTSLLRYSC